MTGVLISVFTRDGLVSWFCQAMLRKRGVVFICGVCRRGVAADDSGVRKRCAVCRRKIVAEFALTEDRSQ